MHGAPQGDAKRWYYFHRKQKLKALCISSLQVGRATRQAHHVQTRPVKTGQLNCSQQKLSKKIFSPPPPPCPSSPLAGLV